MPMQHFNKHSVMQLLQQKQNPKHGQKLIQVSRSVCSGDRLFTPTESQLHPVEFVQIQFQFLQDLLSRARQL
jgi:hypothetical protein